MGQLGSEAVIRDAALVDEAMKKSDLVWVRTPVAPGGRAIWHAWLDGRAYLLTGGGEQPDPGLTVGQTTTVVVRSKDTWGRLMSFEAEVARLAPADADWAAATAQLAKSRLNLREAQDAPKRWAGDSSYVLYRLTPQTGFGERPGSFDDRGGDRAAPVPSPATTTTPKPWVLHKRGGSGPRLS